MSWLRVRVPDTAPNKDKKGGGRSLECHSQRYGEKMTLPSGRGLWVLWGAENRQDKRHLCFPGQHWTPVTQETHTEGPGKWFFREMKG